MSPIVRPRIAWMSSGGNEIAAVFGVRIIRAEAR